MKKLLLLSFFALGFTSQAQWETKATGFSTASTGVNEVSFADANNVWVTGYDGSGGGAQFRVYAKSADAGNTWTSGPINLGSTDLGIGSISAISATTAWVAAFPNTATVQGGIWKTVNGGTTWTKQPTASFNTGIESFTNLVHFWDENSGFCAGDPASGYMEMYTTVNGGTNWTRVPSANLPVPLEGEYGYTRLYETYGNKVWVCTNKGRLYINDNKGVGQWAAYQTPNTDFGGDLGAAITFQDELNGLMISRAHEQYRTTDGGVTWTPEFPDGAIRSGDVTYVPGSTDVLVCIGEDSLDLVRGSSKSTDDGLTWEDLGQAIDAVSTVEFFDATHGFASGFTQSTTAGGIYKWTGTLATVDFNSAKSITASPNPTSGALKIAGKNINAVNVYDVLGKQVLAKKFSTLNEVELDLSALKSGVYMVNVANNAGATSTVKVVKQ